MCFFFRDRSLRRVVPVFVVLIGLGVFCFSVWYLSVLWNVGVFAHSQRTPCDVPLAVFIEVTAFFYTFSMIIAAARFLLLAQRDSENDAANQDEQEEQEEQEDVTQKRRFGASIQALPPEIEDDDDDNDNDNDDDEKNSNVFVIEEDMVTVKPLPPPPPPTLIERMEGPALVIFYVLFVAVAAWGTHLIWSSSTCAITSSPLQFIPSPQWLMLSLYNTAWLTVALQDFAVIYALLNVLLSSRLNIVVDRFFVRKALVDGEKED